VKTVEIRHASADDADEACAVVRRSIVELCHADHQGDQPTIAAWLANKTAENMRRWIAQSHVFVAAEHDRILGIGAIAPSGEITLNYVSPDARFRGVSKALLRRLEQQATEIGAEAVTLHSTATAHRFYGAAGYRDAGPPLEGFGVTSGCPMTKRL
jgi:GNAT superfamily N-acetyltransferase